MSDIKCPFCNGELVGTIGHPICRNQNCVMCDDPMPQDLLEELIRTKELLEIEDAEHSMCHTQMLKTTEKLERTRKAFAVAIDWLEQVATPAKCDDDLCREFTKRKLAEIKTALEQKDK